MVYWLIVSSLYYKIMLLLASRILLIISNYVFFVERSCHCKKLFEPSTFYILSFLSNFFFMLYASDKSSSPPFPPSGVVLRLNNLKSVSGALQWKIEGNETKVHVLMSLGRRQAISFFLQKQLVVFLCFSPVCIYPYAFSMKSSIVIWIR